MAYAGTIGHRRRQGGSGMTGRLVAIALGLTAAGLTGAPIAYMLWPTATAIAPDAPSLPITIGGVAFNVPPASIRSRQRRPGAQARTTSFVWPSLTPPDANIKALPTDAPAVTERLFDHRGEDSTLAGRTAQGIHPRYADAAPIVGTDGLSLQGFRDGSPGRGSDSGRGGAGALHAPLHPPDRRYSRHVPA
jgi:hypothetical protein